jgi:molecular chaperone GrpE (heat shock protein)
MADGLQEKLDTLNAYTQWKVTDSDRTPEAYINYLAREGALEKLEAVISVLDEMERRWAADFEEYNKRDDKEMAQYVHRQLSFLIDDRAEVGV